MGHFIRAWVMIGLLPIGACSVRQFEFGVTTDAGADAQVGSPDGGPGNGGSTGGNDGSGGDGLTGGTSAGSGGSVDSPTALLAGSPATVSGRASVHSSSYEADVVVSGFCSQAGLLSSETYQIDVGVAR